MSIIKSGRLVTNKSKMKFGKNLAKVVAMSDAEWYAFWMNYKYLKKRLKQFCDETSAQQPTEGTKEKAFKGKGEGQGSEVLSERKVTESEQGKITGATATSKSDSVKFDQMEMEKEKIKEKVKEKGEEEEEGKEIQEKLKEEKKDTTQEEVNKKEESANELPNKETSTGIATATTTTTNKTKSQENNDDNQINNSNQKSNDNKNDTNNNGLRTMYSSLHKDEHEVIFFKILHVELRKCSEFYTSLEQQLLLRRKRLLHGISYLKQGDVVCEDNAWTRILGACITFYKDLLLLENYAVMNYCGFSKILKKHDKLTGYTTRELFMKNVVNRQPFTYYPLLLEMLQDMEILVANVEKEVNESLTHTVMHEEERLFIEAIRGMKEEASTLQRREKKELNMEVEVVRAQIANADLPDTTITTGTPSSSIKMTRNVIINGEGRSTGGGDHPINIKSESDSNNKSNSNSSSMNDDDNNNTCSSKPSSSISNGSREGSSSSISSSQQQQNGINDKDGLQRSREELSISTMDGRSICSIDSGHLSPSLALMHTTINSSDSISDQMKSIPKAELTKRIGVDLGKGEQTDQGQKKERGKGMMIVEEDDDENDSSSNDEGEEEQQGQETVPVGSKRKLPLSSTTNTADLESTKITTMTLTTRRTKQARSHDMEKIGDKTQTQTQTQVPPTASVSGVVTSPSESKSKF